MLLRLIHKFLVYLISILALNGICLFVAKFGLLQADYYGIVLLIVVGVFFFYYWMENYAHRKYHIRTLSYALTVLLSEFFLSIFTVRLYCRISGLTYVKTKLYKMNDAEWMLVDIYCILLHVIVLRITACVIRYIIHVAKSKDPF